MRSSYDTRAQRRRELIAQLAAITQELEDLDLQDNGPEPLLHEVGVRVEISRQDEYFGRKGVIISPHGTRFWNVKLDRLKGEETTRIIFKTPRFLRVIPQSPDSEG